MNIYLLQMISKWISLVVVSFMSLFGMVDLNDTETVINNMNHVKNVSVVNEVIEYNTITKYNNKIPMGNKKIITKGMDGLKYKDYEANNEVVIQKSISQVVEIGTGPSGSFVGKITGYGPDCYGCSKTGTVACRTASGKSHSLVNDGIYYKDSDYGKVRILAAATSVFPCGTVVNVSKGNAKFVGVVMDTGYSMRKAMENGQVWMDLAYASQSDARNKGIITGSNIIYEVARWGW